jgi:Cys-rich repeat protein
MSRLTAGLVLLLQVVLMTSCAAPPMACTAAADCTDGSKPYCLESLGACVECNDSSQCKNGFYCDTNGACSPGCETPHGRCALGQYCKPGADCVQCLNDKECPAGDVCAKDVCVPGCTAAKPECGADQVCDVTSGTCVGCVDGSTCAGGVCDPAKKTCVGCTTTADCKDPTKPVCDTGTSTCVGCLPADDKCPAGEYCRPDEVCERGCKAGTDCPSGTCLPTHSCDQCTGDTQCAAGNVCTNGTCTQACSATNACGAGRDCCGGHCIDKTSDNANCGACGTSCGGDATCCNSACKTFDTASDCGSCGKACDPGSGCCGAKCTALNSPTDCGACNHPCTSSQFCDGAACKEVSIPAFCENKNVYAIHDDAHLADGGTTLDNGATDVLASTISTYCPNAKVTPGSQNNPAWVVQDGPDAGALLLGGGSTVVTAGGPFPNKVTKWLERTDKVTKVYFSNNVAGDTFYFKLRSNDSVLVTEPQAWCTPHQDVFVVELAADPASSTLALMAYGLCSPGAGTATAAWYWANVMLPGRADYTDSWYLYEWQDVNGNGVADGKDTFTKISSGK